MSRDTTVTEALSKRRVSAETLRQTFAKTESLFRKNDTDRNDQAFFLLLLDIAKHIIAQPSQRSSDNVYDSQYFIHTVIESLNQLLPYAFNPWSLAKEIAGWHPIENFENLVNKPARQIDIFNGRSRGSTFFIIDPTTFLYSLLTSTLLEFVSNKNTSTHSISLTEVLGFESYIAPRLQSLHKCYAERIHFYLDFQHIATNIDNKNYCPKKLMTQIAKLQDMLNRVDDNSMFKRSIDDAIKLCENKDDVNIYCTFVNTHKNHLKMMQNFLEQRLQTDETPILSEPLKKLQIQQGEQHQELLNRAKDLIRFFNQDFNPESHNAKFIEALTTTFSAACNRNMIEHSNASRFFQSTANKNSFNNKPCENTTEYTP